MLLSRNFKRVVAHITIEPVVILYYVAYALSNVNQQSLLLQKVCHPGDFQPSASLKCDSEADSQKTVSFIQTWKSLFLHLVPVLFVMFAGPWSDSHGKCRKPLMCLPLIGQIIADTLCLLNIYFWSWPPALVALCGSIPASLTGWRSCFNIGMHCYISDCSSVKSRTWRIGVCVGLVFLGIPVGGFIFGSAFHLIRNQGIFIICIMFNLIAVIYLMFMVDEIKPLDESSSVVPSKDVFNFAMIKDSIKTTFSARSGHKRSIVLLMILASPVTINPIEGEFAVLYLFLRYQFNWDEQGYGFYAAYKTIIICFGTVVSMGILSRFLKVSDAGIGILASLTLMAASTGYTFATQPWQLFVYPIVDFLQGAGLAVVSSIISKNVESHELGQVNSVVGVIDAVFPLLNIPLYTQVYNHTFTQLAGGFFLISFAYGAVGLVLFSTVYCFTRKQETKENLGEVQG